MLKGDKIILRPLKITDLDKTIQWRNDIELLKLTQGIRFPKTHEMEKAWFEKVLNDTSNKNIYFGIDEISTNDFIGIIQLNNIDYISGNANWGLNIGEIKKRGKNYSIEASNLLFHYAFNILNLRKLTGFATAFNKPALMLHHSIGNFKLEGTLKKHYYFDNNYHDILILSLFKDNYLK